LNGKKYFAIKQKGTGIRKLTWCLVLLPSINVEKMTSNRIAKNIHDFTCLLAIKNIFGFSYLYSTTQIS